MVQCWCLKCSLSFPDFESRNHHLWHSGFHIFCKACIRHIGGITILLDEFDSRDALLDHCQMDHFGCPCCFYCDDDHYGCSGCSDKCVFRACQKGYERKDCYFDFTDKNHDHTNEDHFSSCEDDTLFQCLQCPHTTVFDTAEDLDRHLRTRHGLVYCPYISTRSQIGSCIAPQVCWHSQERGHMEGCYHPNPCNDFNAMEAVGKCQLCNHAFQEPADVLEHYYAFHPCNECAHYISLYYKIQDNHLDECHQDETPPPSPPLSPLLPAEESPINIYAILGIHPQSSHEEAKGAARQRRIDTHPDKLKRACRTEAEKFEIDETAKLVGYAADIVLDPAKRLAYDETMREWTFNRGIF